MMNGSRAIQRHGWGSSFASQQLRKRSTSLGGARVAAVLSVGSLAARLRWNDPKDAEAAKLSEGNEEARGSRQPFAPRVFQSHPKKIVALDAGCCSGEQQSSSNNFGATDFACSFGGFLEIWTPLKSEGFPAKIPPYFLVKFQQTYLHTRRRTPCSFPIWQVKGRVIRFWQPPLDDNYCYHPQVEQ